MAQSSKYPFLPLPESFPFEAPDPPTEGWWQDPYEGDGPVAQRYHDGRQWTQYTSLLAMRKWSDIIETPVPESEG